MYTRNHQNRNSSPQRIYTDHKPHTSQNERRHKWRRDQVRGLDRRRYEMPRIYALCHGRFDWCTGEAATRVGYKD